jgi:hypothetical protein
MKEKLKTNKEIEDALRQILKINDYKIGSKKAITAEFSFIQGIIFGNPKYANTYLYLCLMSGRSILS